MEPLLFLPVILSFFVTLVTMPSWIRKAKESGKVWEDMNKFGHPKNVSGSGGIVVLMGFVLGVLAYIAIKTFVLHTNVTTVEIFALLATVLICAVIALVDDILGWEHGGLSAKIRIVLFFIAAVPLMVISSGNSEINIPFLGVINFGIIYPLILIPLAIIGTTSTFNMLAGFNGLEAGQGILLIGSLSIIAFYTESSWLALIGLCMAVALAAFLIFNKCPAKVFPGNILTYPIGALIAIFAILGNFERIAVFLFIPYIIETVLKTRGKLKKQSFGKPNEDNSLEMPYDKIYGLEHLAIFILKKFKKDKKVYEKDVVYLIHGFQIAIIIAGFIIFRKAIFYNAG